VTLPVRRPDRSAGADQSLAWPVRSDPNHLLGVTEIPILGDGANGGQCPNPALARGIRPEPSGIHCVARPGRNTAPCAHGWRHSTNYTGRRQEPQSTDRFTGRAKARPFQRAGRWSQNQGNHFDMNRSKPDQMKDLDRSSYGPDASKNLFFREKEPQKPSSYNLA
jgi:hypothetical protein